MRTVRQTVTLTKKRNAQIYRLDCVFAFWYGSALFIEIYWSFKLTNCTRHPYPVIWENWSTRRGEAQISWQIHAVWSEPSIFAYRIVEYCRIHQKTTKALIRKQKHSMIWGFPDNICHENLRFIYVARVRITELMLLFARYDALTTVRVSLLCYYCSL